MLSPWPVSLQQLTFQLFCHCPSTQGCGGQTENPARKMPPISTVLPREASTRKRPQTHLCFLSFTAVCAVDPPRALVGWQHGRYLECEDRFSSIPVQQRSWIHGTFCRVYRPLQSTRDSILMYRCSSSLSQMGKMTPECPSHQRSPHGRAHETSIQRH